MSRSGLAATLVLAVTLLGCAGIGTGGPRSVQAGMSRTMLMATMGSPDDRIIGTNYSALKWFQRDENKDPVEFWAILQNGVVVTTGYGELREDAAGNLTIVPLRR